MKFIITIACVVVPFFAFPQNAEAVFHAAAGQYIGERTQEAKRTIDDGLRRYPNDPKLTALKNKIKEDEKKKQQNQEQKDQEKKDQQKNDEQKNQKQNEKKDQKDQGEEKDQKEKQEQEKKEQEKKEAEQKPDDKKDDKDKKEIPPSVSDKLKEMQMSEDKARMILEAMRNQEKQYLQQNKRKATKPKPGGKPDW